MASGRGRDDSGLISFVAGEALEADRLVRLDASGELIYCDKGEKPLGVTDDKVASGDNCPVALLTKQGTHRLTASGAISILDELHTDDDGKVTATPTGCKVATALEAASGDGSIFEAVTLAGVDLEGLIYAAIAASAAVANTAAETAFDKSKTIDGAGLKAGDVIRVRLQGIATATNSTDTLNVKLYVGTQEIVATGALDVANDNIFVIDVDVVVRVAGVSGKLVAAGWASIGAAGTATAKAVHLAESAEDLSGDLAIAAKATWSAANAGNSCRLDVMNVQILRA